MEARSIMAKRITALLFPVFCLALPVAVEAMEFEYVVNRGSVTIINYTGNDGMVAIPGKIGGLPVARVGGHAFQNSDRMSEVVIPRGVASIGEWAFCDCTGLTNVIIPSSVTSIEPFAFDGCTRLVSITVDERNPAFSSVDGVLYDKSRTKLIRCPGGKIGSIIIPHKVIIIESWAFDACPGLTAIMVDPRNPLFSSVDGVLFDKNQTVLFRCPGGKVGTCTIPNTITDVGRRAFDSCAGISAITVDAQNASFRSVDGVLFDKQQTTLIRYPEGKAGSYTIPKCVIDIGHRAFDACGGLSAVVIPEGITEIKYVAFSGCTGLVSVTVPSSLSNIESTAFTDCVALKEVYFHGNAPNSDGGDVFCSNVIIRYLPETKGWRKLFADRPTAQWVRH
jgi:hypothetical protein